MPVDKSEFQIKVSTTADLAGLDATIAKLNGQIDATKMLGQSTASLEKELQKAQQTKIDAELAKITGRMQEGGKAGEESAHGIEKLGLTHRQLGATLRQVAPGIAEIAHFLTNGLAGAVGVCLIAFEFLKSKIEAFNQALEELDTGPGAKGEWAEKIRDNTREAAVETALFNLRLRETQEREDTLSDATERLIAQQKRQADAAKALGDAQKELALARLALQEKLGQITPDQAVQIRLEIDDAAFKRQLAAEKAAIQAELAARQQEYNANENREPVLNEAMQRTAAAALAAKNAQDKNEAEIKQAKENEEKIKEKQKENQKWLDENPDDWGHKLEGPERKLRQQTAATYDEQLKGLRRTIRQDEAKQTPLQTAASLAKEEAERAKSDYEEAAKLSAEVRKTMDKLKADLAAATAKNDALQQAHDQTSANTHAANEQDIIKKVTGMDRRDLAIASGLPPSLVDQLMNGGGTAAQQEDLQRRTAQTALRNLHGTDSRDNQQVADWANQALWSQTPREQVDVGSARNALNDARSAVRNHQGSDPVLHSLLNEYLGLAHDIHATMATRNQFDQLAQEVTILRSQLQTQNGQTY